jgi:plasmid stabilization system protein ParE
MTYRIMPSDRAESDLARIYDWLAARSPGGAARWYEAFWDATERLMEYPYSCPRAAEAARLPEDVREMLFGTRKGRTYRALFVVEADIVHILCVRGPGEKHVRSEDIEF